jgi:cytochrome c-type biogenesis protein CcmF
MNVGQVSVWVAFLAAGANAYFFYRDGRNSSRSRQAISTGIAKTASHRLYWIMLLAGAAASGILIELLLTHQFQYSYVAHYSSRSLPLFYLISAFWAGQEGTFLLWALMVSVMGWVFIKTSENEDGFAMSVVSGYCAFLYLLLIVKSPFEMTSTIPEDGAGLNPLLQNPWMVVHPPILFMGYAATVFPFALVVSALARRNTGHWFESGFVWSIFATLTLGAGIIIGGFWAYEVLGWGGYWGWDPVENSSLVPWLVLLALIHGFLVQRARGSLVRTNMFLAIFAFLLVLYATFLTRSGILADFSVHSFVDLGISNYLIGVMVVGAALGLGWFAVRFRDFTSPRIPLSGLNREITLLLGLWVLVLGALFTFVGMSSPILTGLFGKASQVDTSFYNKVNLPVAIGIALLLGVTPFLGWTEENKWGFAKRLSMPLSLTVLTCVIAYVAGVTTAALLAFVGSASFGLISNVVIAFRKYRSGWLTLGGPITHIGTGLLLIGIIGSGSFDETRQTVLRLNEPQTIFGYQCTFKGSALSSDQRTQIQIEVSDGRNTYAANPKLFFSTYNQSMLREPDIKIFPMKDLYISPIELRSSQVESPHATLEITKGEKKTVGGYQIEFVRFETGQHSQPGNMSVGAVLNVSLQGETHEVTPTMTINEQGERNLIPADLPAVPNMGQGSAKPQVALTGMSVEQKKVMLELLGFDEHAGARAVQELVVEISTKPLMMVVWTGVMLIIAGTAIALKRRLTKNTLSQDPTR